MPIIDKNNVYIAKSLIKASIKPDLILTVLQLKTDNDTDPRTTCNCCSSAYQLEKTIHIFEDRVYKFTYYNENIFYENMIGEVTHIECDPNFPDSGYVEVKAYLTEEDVKRKVYANIKRIPITNIQNAIDITPYESPIEQGDDYKLMILGISAQKVRALVINLKMINDDELDQAVKEVSLIVGNRYKICYNSKDNELDCLIGTLTGMVEIPNLDQEFGTGYNPNCGFVRENGECKYPEYNKYYLGNNNESCCDGCPIAGNCSANEEISFYNNTYEKDRFLRLPENMVSDVLLTFDVTSDTDTTTVYKKIYLSQIRDVCSMYLIEDPASTDLRLETINKDSALLVYAKNSRIIALKDGVYDSWEEAEIIPEDIVSLYQNSYLPILINLYESDGQYTVLSEFVDNTRSLKNIDFVGATSTTPQKMKKFIDNFNAWVMNNLCFNGDYTKPLITAEFPEDEEILFTLNYYDIDNLNDIGQIAKLLDPNVIDDFIINVIIKSFGCNIGIGLHPEGAGEEYSIYDSFSNISNGINLYELYKYIINLITRFLEDAEFKSPYDQENSIYILNNSDLMIAGSNMIGDQEWWIYISYLVKFNTESDKESFENIINVLYNNIYFDIKSGQNIGFRAFQDDNILCLYISMGNQLYEYLENINPDIRTSINKFNIGSFLEIFNNIDILNDQYRFPDNDSKRTVNSILIFIQKLSRIICHILCNAKNALLYKNDNTKIKLIDDNKIFDMEPIDTSYELYDPKGFYKLCKAFKNVFTDFVNNSNMSQFDYYNIEPIPTDYEYAITDNIFNISSELNIGHAESLKIPFSISIINAGE